MLNPFNVLRQMAKVAVVNGVHDGLAEVADRGGEPLADMDELRERITNNTAVAALEAAGEPKKGGKK